MSDDEKARRLRAATVACFPSSEGESFGIVLLEAMAAGAAVVASDLTGYRNVARDGQEAVLVAPDDPHALRAAIRGLLDDGDRRARLAAGGSQRAAEFSFARLADQLVPLYSEAVVTRRRELSTARR